MSGLCESPLSMKPTIASILFFASVALPALGNTYHGSIVQTIEGTDIPLYHVGQTFLGYYEYESPSIDGTFYTNNFDPPLLGVNYSLDGSIYMPFATSFIFIDQDGNSWPLTYGPGGMFEGLTATIDYGKLVVAGGHVSNFLWAWENGGFYMQASENTFEALSFYNYGGSGASGSLVFGDPVNVPDEPSTASLLGGVLVAGLVLIRRQVACRCRSLNQG